MRQDRSNIVPRSQRFTIKRLEQVRATIEREDQREPPIVNAEPLDISEGGVKLRLPVALEFEEPIQLRLKSDDGYLDLTLSCRISWIKQERKDAWLMGCNFVPELPSAALEQMFTTGLIERRRFQRYPIDGKAVAQWELVPGSFNVHAVDISESGFCIIAPRAGQTGQRMRLTVGEGESSSMFHAKAQWCARLEKVYMVGCAFLDHQSYVSLKDALTQAGAEAVN